ncbi:MAG: SAM-dependent methyltransferase [Anaerovoracaceae bacterium]
MDILKQLLDDCIFHQTFVKMIFANQRKKSLPYKKVIITPVLLQGTLMYQAEYHYETKVIHDNLSRDELMDFCMDLVLKDFKQINVFTEEKNIQVLASKIMNPKIIESAPTKKQGNLDHNQKKNYIIPDLTPCDFLVRLGVMDSKGKVVSKHYSKFRQINRFLEIVNDEFDQLPKNANTPLKIIDFGCGKAYLTFALYHYLKVIRGRNVEIVGLDLKEDVINFCNKVTEDLGYKGLSFVLGDIADYTSSNVDMVVTLHACDTATDFALINAVNWKSKVILSVPCCQHELFGQIDNKLHQPMFKHGIVKDKFTELLTDGLRGLKLESKGYEVTMMEFTSLEHTSKNIMIKAVKTRRPNKNAIEEYTALKDFYKVTPLIDQL